MFWREPRVRLCLTRNPRSALHLHPVVSTEDRMLCFHFSCLCVLDRTRTACLGVLFEQKRRPRVCLTVCEIHAAAVFWWSLEHVVTPGPSKGEAPWDPHVSDMIEFLNHVSFMCVALKPSPHNVDVWGSIIVPPKRCSCCRRWESVASEEASDRASSQIHLSTPVDVKLEAI